MALPASSAGSEAGALLPVARRSLSVGWQPNPATGVGHQTNTGYPDDLATLEKSKGLTLHEARLSRRVEHELELKGGICKY